MSTTSERSIGHRHNTGRYEIRLKRAPRHPMAAWFEGLAVAHGSDGTTIVDGPVPTRPRYTACSRNARPGLAPDLGQSRRPRPSPDAHNRDLTTQQSAKGTDMAITVQPLATKPAEGMMLTWMSMKQRRVVKAAAAACALLGAAGLTAFGAGTPVAHAAVLAGRHGPPTSAQCRKDLGVACYSPSQIQRAYDLPSLYARGLTGRGRTIVIVDPFGSPTMRHDLRVFDTRVRPARPASFRVLQPVGKVPPYDPKNPDMVKRPVRRPSTWRPPTPSRRGRTSCWSRRPRRDPTGGGFPQFMAAENYVITHDLGDVISQSFGIPEQNFPGRAAIARLRYAYLSARRHHVTVLAATNDFGVTGPTPAAVSTGTGSSTGPPPTPWSRRSAAPGCG